MVIAIQGHDTGYHLTFFINDAVLAVIAGQDQCIFHRSHIYEIPITIALVIRMLRQWIVRIDMFLTGINHEFFWDDLFSVQGTLMQKQMSKTSQFINRQIQSVSCHTMSLRAEGPVRIRNANRFKETISQIIQQTRSGFLFQKNR